MHLKPDPRAGKIVPVQRLRNRKRLTKPDGIRGCLVSDGDRLPGAVIEVCVFSMGDVAYMDSGGSSLAAAADSPRSAEALPAMSRTPISGSRNKGIRRKNFKAEIMAKIPSGAS
jgi:hypothetical protein